MKYLERKEFLVFQAEILEYAGDIGSYSVGLQAYIAKQVREAYETGWADGRGLLKIEQAGRSRDRIHNADTSAIIYSKSQGWEE